MPRIAVIGPGAIGATIAAYLSRNADVQLSICARTPFEEIVLEAPAGTLRASPPIYLEHKRATIADWVIVATKAYDNESVSAWLPHVADAATRLAVLQNGVEHAERFHLTFDAFRILPTVIDLRSERIGPGHVRERRTGSIYVPDCDKGRSFSDLFQAGGLDVRATKDFTTAAWRKLCFNCAGAVSAVALASDVVARFESAADLAELLVMECAQVGRAEGADLEPDIAKHFVDVLRRSSTTNSMLADRLAGRSLEIDARNGVVVRKGAAHGIPTPANAFVVSLLGGDHLADVGAA